MYSLYKPESVFWYAPPTWTPVRSAVHKKIKSQAQVKRVFGHAGKFYVI